MSADPSLEPASPGPDVSVIVPVYNPGLYIENCINGLLSQTLDPSRCQFIFVDDGSTDDTPARLAELAGEHPNVVFRPEPHSGWPGRPRNIGIDLADGEFVFFCDHDDWLAPDGLAALVQTARRTNADIVVGKMVGQRRKVAVELFRTNRDHATVFDSDLMWALTPHKLFRRSFLAEHGLRFPEGKRRLEDHTFVTAAYFAAGSIAILADRPVYHHIRRDDMGNAAYGDFDPAGYFRDAREAMDIVTERTEPGEVRDRLMWRFLRGQMLERLSEPGVLRATEEQIAPVFDEIRTLLHERYPDSALERLCAVPRARALAIRDGRLDVVRDIAARAAEIVARGTVVELSETAGSWRLEVDARLVDKTGEALTLREAEDGWRVPQLIPEPADRASTTAEVMSSARARITLRERESWEEWVLPASVSPELVPLAVAGSYTLVTAVVADLDPLTAAGGRPLPPGSWQVALGLTGLGLTRRSRLVAGQSIALPPALIYADPPLLARFVLVGSNRNLRLDVANPARGLPAVISAGLRAPVAASRDRLRVALPVTAAAGVRPLQCWIELRPPGVSRGARYQAAIRPTKGGGATLAARFPAGRRPAAGSYQLWLGFGPRRPFSQVGEARLQRDSLRSIVRRYYAALRPGGRP